jgi:ubiquinone/menaquinone biosynthesis C-methylase UbiE/uncharacterized protein YbaR (Trm112 family)
MRAAPRADPPATRYLSSFAFSGRAHSGIPFTSIHARSMSTDALSSDIPAALERVLDRMRCPRCSGRLRTTVDGADNASEAALACGACGARYPVRQGIPLLAIHGTVETWREATADESSVDYQKEYEELVEARKYNEAYRDKRTKRWSTNREYRLLQRLLGSQPHSETLLDIPSGGGRLSAQLATHADFLVEADIGRGQLLYARENYPGRDDRIWMTASAFHIPFEDASVDGVVCCRLCHHLPTADERERLLAELLRVSKRFVIMTFFDYHSVKNYVRRARRPFDGQPPKMTMTVQRVAELARENGAELVAQPTLSRLFSGHRYGLMVKS